MPRITRESLMTLEAYAKARPQFRERVISHKKNRTLHLGAHLTLIFEDELTMRYQIQEMLRVERIFEEDGIQAEIAAYDPLVPDGTNWKATLLVAYTDPEERRQMLARLIGIEDRVWVKAGALARVYAVADEDLDRENDEKTSSVHFLRFELQPEMISALKGGAPLAAGVDHAHYSVTAEPIDSVVVASLLKDLT